MPWLPKEEIHVSHVDDGGQLGRGLSYLQAPAGLDDHSDLETQGHPPAVETIASGDLT